MSDKGIVTAIDGLRLRTGPSTGTTALDLMPLHAVVEVLETRGNWHRVRWLRQEGWASAKYINVIPPTSVTRPTRKFEHWLRWAILAAAAGFVLYLVAGYAFP